MKNQLTENFDKQPTVTNQQSRNVGFDIIRVKHTLKKSWIWISLILISSIVIAFFLNRYTKPIYISESIIKLEFDENFKLKKDLNVKGDIKTANIKISEKYEIKNLIGNFLYKKNSFYFSELSWNFSDKKNIEREFFKGELNFSQTKKKIRRKFKI